MNQSNRLDNDCLKLIFEYLTLKEKIGIIRVCRRWKALMESLLLRERCLVISTTFNQPLIFCSHLTSSVSSPPQSPSKDYFDEPPWQKSSLSTTKRLTNFSSSNATGSSSSSSAFFPDNSSSDHFCRSNNSRTTTTNTIINTNTTTTTTTDVQPMHNQFDTVVSSSFPPWPCPRMCKEALLILSITEKLTMLQFNSLLIKLPRLASIAFHSRKNYELVSQHVLSSVMDKCESLSAIDLSDCREVTTECLTVLANKCGSTLRYLNLSGCRSYGNIGLKQILRSCHLLEKLILCHNRRISGLFFSHFGGQKLKHIDLTSCTGYTNRGLHMLAEKTRHSLQTFISYPISSVYTLNFVCSHFQNLRKLVLTLMAELDLNPITLHLHQLRSLSLFGVIQLSPTFFQNLMSSCVHMIEFELCLGIPKVAHSIPIWTRMRKLRLLNLRFDQDRNQLQALACLEHVQSLQISSTDFKDDDIVAFLTQFRSFGHLQTLDLDYFQKEKNVDLDVELVQNLLTKKGHGGQFEVKVNRLKLNKMSLYLTKLIIRRKQRKHVTFLQTY